MALIGHLSRVWLWVVALAASHASICAGTIVCCLPLECGPGARGQLQTVPELRGLPPGPGPLLCLERLQLPAPQPLPP